MSLLLDQWEQQWMPPLSTHRFDPDSMMRTYMAHLQVTGLLRSSENEPAGQPPAQVNVIRPAVDHGFHSVDPRTLGKPGVKPSVHCVYTRSLHDHMLRNGYVECCVTYHDRDVQELPGAVPLAARIRTEAAAGEQQEQEDVEVQVVRIPATEASMSRKKGGPTAAEELVTWMESGVTIDEVSLLSVSQC
jgi:hypothetical protein